MTFHEQWYSDEQIALLVSTYAQTRAFSGAILEVGCWEGRSTVALANAAAPQRIYAIDHWRGTAAEGTDKLAAARDIRAAFDENVRSLTQGNIIVCAEDWRVFFARWRGPIKFLHLDGAHTHDEVADNIRAALPWIIPGGILCGDDRPHIVRALADTLGSVHDDARFWWWRNDL